MRGISGRLVISLTVLAALAAGSPVLAHKVNVFAYEEEGTVYTESYFVDGTPCRQSQVVVFGPQDQVLVKGKTDQEGLFSFSIDPYQDVRIVLEASMGHRNEMRLAASEMSGGASRKTDEEERATTAAGETIPPSREISSLIPETPKGVSVEGTRADVEEILDDRLKPIQREIADLRRSLGKPGLSDIIGGLGWIIGLAGAYLWGASRRKRP